MEGKSGTTWNRFEGWHAMDVRFSNDIFLFAKNAGMSICFFCFLDTLVNTDKEIYPMVNHRNFHFVDKIVDQHSSTSLKTWTTCP